jgi:ATP-dependent protease ClpP protease subunit
MKMEKIKMPMTKTKSWFTMSADSGIATIKIHREIGSWGINAESFSQQLDALGDVSELKIYINSPGGDVVDGFAIYNMLRRHPAKKVVTIDGVAASIASVIAMAADTLIMPANSFLMIHNPYSIMSGDSSDLRSAADLLDKMKANAIAAYRRKASTLSSDEVSQMMTDETWLTADEATEKGFADIIEEAISVETVDEEDRFENRFTAVPQACMCYFKRPKNHTDGKAPKAEARPAGDGAPAAPVPQEIINTVVNKNETQTITGVNSMPMSVKDIVTRTTNAKNRIDNEISGLVKLPMRRSVPTRPPSCRPS